MLRHHASRQTTPGRGEIGQFANVPLLMPRAYACLALLTVVAVVLAGCGSTTSTTSASVASQPSTAAATTPAAASAAGVHTTPTTSIATQGKATGTTTGEGPVHAAATVSTSPSQLCSTFT